MIGNTIRAIFNWLFKQFDLKIVPDVPKKSDIPWWFNSRPSYPSENRGLGTYTYWNSKPMTENGLGNILNVYTDFINKPRTPTIPEWNTSWLWYTGLAILSAGALYLGFKFIIEPVWLSPVKINPETSNMNPEIVVNDVRSNTGLLSALGAMTGSAITGVSNGITSGVASMGEKIVHVLNPWNYLPTQNVVQTNYDSFMQNQANILENRSNQSLYPYTENNPFDPWYKKLRLSIYGETANDKLIRIKDLAQCNTQIEQNIVQNSMTPMPVQTHPGTPNPLGIGVQAIHSETVIDKVHEANIFHKLKSTPITPIEVPSETNEWFEHSTRRNSPNSSGGTSPVISNIIPDVESDLDSPTRSSSNTSSTVTPKSVYQLNENEDLLSQTSKPKGKQKAV
jgi:hypothetical protein